MKYILSLLLISCFGNDSHKNQASLGYKKNVENIELVKLIFDDKSSGHQEAGKCFAHIEFISYIFNEVKLIKDNLKGFKVEEKENEENFDKIKNFLLEILIELDKGEYDVDYLLDDKIIANLDKVAALFQKKLSIKDIERKYLTFWSPTHETYGITKVKQLNISDIGSEDEKLSNFWEQDLIIDKFESNMLVFQQSLFSVKALLIKKLIEELKEKEIVILVPSDKDNYKEMDNVLNGLYELLNPYIESLEREIEVCIKTCEQSKIEIIEDFYDLVRKDFESDSEKQRIYDEIIENKPTFESYLDEEVSKFRVTFPSKNNLTNIQELMMSLNSLRKLLNKEPKLVPKSKEEEKEYIASQVISLAKIEATVLFISKCFDNFKPIFDDFKGNQDEQVKIVFHFIEQYFNEMLLECNDSLRFLNDECTVPVSKEIISKLRTLVSALGSKLKEAKDYEDGNNYFSVVPIEGHKSKFFENKNFSFNHKVYEGNEYFEIKYREFDRDKHLDRLILSICEKIYGGKLYLSKNLSKLQDSFKSAIALMKEMFAEYRSEI